MTRLVSIVLAVVLALAVVISGVATVLSASDPPRPGTSAPAAAAVPSANTVSLSAATTAAAAAAAPSVVKIQTGQGLGSGVIVDTRGYIVTNYHVLIDPQSRVTASTGISVTLSGGQSYAATIISTDAPDDLAVLKITAPHLRAMPLANSANVRTGEFVLALGNPLGYAQSVTFGIVSTPKRTVAENGPATFIPDMIQTSAPINPGNSGGALVNLQGQLIGIPTLAAADPRLGTPAQGIGFAIPSNRVAFIMKQVIAQGKVVHSGRPYLGLTNIEEVTPALTQRYGLDTDHGVLIRSLAPEGPAARAGLQAGEVIVQLHGHATPDQAALGEALAQLQPAQQVKITVVGQSGQHTRTVTLGELPLER